jgi:hypothetical protein
VWIRSLLKWQNGDGGLPEMSMAHSELPKPLPNLSAILLRNRSATPSPKTPSRT